MSARRLAQGGLIDRDTPMRFRLDGRGYDGFAGDTLASALLANGVRIVGRSFKYHRPRGLWGAWFDDPNGVMDVTLNGQSQPNCIAAMTPLVHGMHARAVNAWPNAALDVKSGLDVAHRFLGAGFYYKTFIWPDWHLFEPSIRRMAGLGRLSGIPDARGGDQLSETCDTLVVGGGAAGLSAARASAEAGRDTVLVEDHTALGGGAFAMQTRIADAAPADWVDAQRRAILAAGGRILTQTTAFGVYDHGLVGLAQDMGFGAVPRLIRMRSRRMIMATGAVDRPLTFANNDLPGIMSLGGALEYLGRYGVLVGKQITILSNHSGADHAEDLLSGAGADIRRLDAAQVTAEGIGRRAIRAVSYGNARHQCDTLLVSGGWTPLVHLWRHAGGKLDWDETLAAFVPGAGPAQMTAIGAANGCFDLETAIAQGAQAGRGTAITAGRTSYSLVPVWPKPKARGRQWIDFQHDVTLKDIETAAQENFTSVEHLKRYTTLGMAVDQGKTSNMAGLAAMAALQGKPIPEVGTTTFRPPFVPVPLSLYKGAAQKQMFHPLKRLALEDLHRSEGAAMGEYGGWLRPGWYGTGDPETAAAREVRQARGGAGLLDAAPLGKIEVMGPDAEAFVNFIFYNTMQTLKPGRIRYGFILTEQGVIYDDGVVARLGPEQFVISCSSSHVDGIMGLLEAWRQDGNDPDRIFVHDTTQAWQTVTITGPDARRIVQGLGTDIDVSTAALPHMSLAESQFDGAPIRIARVSFTGDLSFEISTGTTQAVAIWRKARDLGAHPLGLEAVSIMRAEKGFIIVGKETDGETMPHDLGFAAPRAKKRSAYLGDRGLQTQTANRTDRQQLVGLELAFDGPKLETGAHLVSAGVSEGFVTSSYDSPTLGRPIALALLRRGHARHGEEVSVWHLGQTRAAKVVAPCFWDPKGARLNAE